MIIIKERITHKWTSTHYCFGGHLTTRPQSDVLAPKVSVAKTNRREWHTQATGENKYTIQERMTHNQAFYVPTKQNITTDVTCTSPENVEVSWASTKLPSTFPSVLWSFQGFLHPQHPNFRGQWDTCYSDGSIFWPQLETPFFSCSYLLLFDILAFVFL